MNVTARLHKEVFNHITSTMSGQDYKVTNDLAGYNVTQDVIPGIFKRRYNITKAMISIVSQGYNVTEDTIPGIISGNYNFTKDLSEMSQGYSVTEDISRWQVTYWGHIPVAVFLALAAVFGTVTNTLVAWVFL